MNNKTLLTLFAASATVFGAGAQSLREGYINWPNSETLTAYVQQWKQGKLNMEDENFFISRVKPKARFTNAATQVNENLLPQDDRRVCLWLPITTSKSGEYNFNALPNAAFDSEVFSNWSYVSVFGDWTSPHGWVPGAFADVAHKNGVGVSGVASIPYGGNSNWNNALSDQVTKVSNQDVAEFLWAHGVDGLGYNSEFSGNASTLAKLAQQHGDIIEFLEGKGIVTAENIWYDGTSYTGGISFDRGLGSHNLANFCNNGKRRSSLFFNYNWQGILAGSVTAADNAKVSPLYLYAGMNMQGGEPKSGESYPVLKNHRISLGYWGAHQYNMFWLNRTANGSSATAAQSTYLYDTERFATNGAQNPAVDFDIYTQRNHYPTDKFFGLSAFSSAKSSLCWNLDEEPFISYFNLGNGRFFNWMGTRANSQEWYNIGVQDYLPTWRYWWAPTLLGRHIKADDVNMKATFTWDDAYFGGSSLKITGSDKEAYLHLFKTKFELKRNDVITVRYKLLSGSAENVSLVLTAEGDESTPLREDRLALITADTEADDEVWQEVQIPITGAIASSFNNKTVALIALHFTNADNLDMLLGEVSIKRGTYATPATPEITLAKVLAYHKDGVDGKLIFKMPNDKAANEPCYNLDVNTSMFKIYGREDGGEPILLGVTTSWAAMIYSMPVDLDSDAKVQFGVSAVSLDFETESPIAWSGENARGNYTIANDVVLDKPVIKPNEPFTVSYSDPKHAASDWSILDRAGKQVASATNATQIVVENGLPEVAAYDVVINAGTDSERRLPYYVQVSSEAVGAMPAIYSVSVNGSEPNDGDPAISLEIPLDAEVTAPVTVAYTGRDADGVASRGLQINEHFIGTNVGDLGLQASQSFTVAFWVKYDQIPVRDWALLDITNRSGSWPKSNWGYCWLRGASDGSIGSYVFRGSTSDGSSPGELKYEFPNVKFQPQIWTHVAITFDYKNSQSFRSNLYINGVKQDANWYRGAGGSGTGTTDTYAAKSWNIDANDWLSTGGLPYEGSSLNGVVDDFVVWNGVMTDADVNTVMKGLDENALPSQVIGFWNFENEPTQSSRGIGFRGKGSKSNCYLYNFECVSSADAKEGQGVQTPFTPYFSAGCPFLPGTAYQVKTVPSWTGRKVLISDATGSGKEGSASVAFNRAGDYTLELTLANPYGEDKATYPVFTVTNEESGINDIAANGDLKVYTVAEGLFVEFAEAGDYAVFVYNVQGQRVAQKGDRVDAGAMMQIALGRSGVYMVEVVKDGTPVRTFKVLKP